MNIPGLGGRNQSEGDLLISGYSVLREANQARLRRYRIAEERYERSRDPRMVELRTSGDSDDYAARSKSNDAPKRHRIPLNFEHAITQKHAFRVAGRPPDVLVPGNSRSAAERFRSDTIEKMIYGVYRYSDWEMQLASGGHHASLLGAACFDIWKDKETAYQMPRIRELHPGTVLAVPGLDRVHDFECVYRFWRVPIVTVKERYGGVELPFGDDLGDIKPDEDGGDWCLLIEKTDRMTKTRFTGRVVLEVGEHNYGFCPYVIIPNLGPIEKMWGYSDWEFYKDPVAYYEALFSRQADVVRGTAGGAMQDFGSGQDSRKVLKVIRDGGLVEVKNDGIKPIETPQFGDWHDAHMQAARAAIDDLGFVPPASWGAVGSATSGTDRALQLGPQLELTGLKQIHWTAGIKRINELVLRLLEQTTSDAITFRGSKTRGHRTSPFTLVVNAAAAEAPDLMQEDDGLDSFDPNTGAPTEIPDSPAKLIDGDYCTEIVWQTRLDRDDPQFVLQELNKFSQGIQSAYTTLERLGVADPDEELKLLEREADRFPWMRSGMVAMVRQALAANQAQGGGGAGGADGSAGTGDLSGAIDALTGGGGGGSGALGFDAQARALSGSSNEGEKTEGRVPGATYGGA